MAIAGVVDSIMNGMQFQEPQKAQFQTATMQSHTPSTRAPKSNDLNPIIKTTTNFVDKNLELVVPLNKGK